MSNNCKPSLNALTGLRFVAAATVFVHHLGGKFGFETNRYSIGSVAVTFFFILSGFVLTYAYHDRIGSQKQVKRFLFNRFARIWPLHFVCLLIAAALVYLDSRLAIEPFWQKLAVNSLLLQSWVPANDWVFSFNGVAWSISTEAFFYAMFPLMMFAGGKLFNARVAIAMMLVAAFGLLASFLSSLQWQELDYLRVGHVSPLIRLPEFCLGILAGICFLRTRDAVNRSEPRRLLSGFVWTLAETISVLTVLALCYWVTEQRFRFQIETNSWGGVFLASWFRVAYPAIPMAIAVFVFANGKGFISSLLSTRLMTYLGDISYALYMIHFLVLRTISMASISYGELTGWHVAGLSLLISIGLSILLYELVELPAKRLLLRCYNRQSESVSTQNRISVPRYRLTVAVLLSVVSCFCLAIAVPQESRSQEITNIIGKSEPGCRRIPFGGKVKLLGCDVEAQPDKQRVKLELAWVKQVPFDHRRLVFVLDGNGKQIARGMHNQTPFENSDTGVEFIDKVFLPLDRIDNGSEVVVCFRKKGDTPIKASSGNRRHNNKSLVLLDRNRLDELRSELSAESETGPTE